MPLTCCERAVVDEALDLIDERAELITGCVRLAGVDFRPDLVKLADQRIALSLCETTSGNQRLHLGNERVDRIWRYRCPGWKGYTCRTISDRYAGSYSVGGSIYQKHCPTVNTCHIDKSPIRRDSYCNVGRLLWPSVEQRIS